eukprot:498882-Pleurochrysis_carterae.AAC.1
MACGDNPEANITISVSLLWIQTERAPVKGETISPVASWQYQAAGLGAQEYIPHSTLPPSLALALSLLPCPSTLFPLSLSLLHTRATVQLTLVPSPALFK